MSDTTKKVEAELPLKQYVWDGRGAYKMIVHASSVAEARELAKVELEVFGGASDTSPAGRAHRAIAEDMPHIYHRANAEFVVTENGETEELNELLEAQDAKRKSAEAALAECQRDRDALKETLKNLRSNYAGYAITSKWSEQDIINLVKEFYDHIYRTDKAIDAALRTELSKGEKDA